MTLNWWNISGLLLASAGGIGWIIDTINSYGKVPTEIVYKHHKYPEVNFKQVMDINAKGGTRDVWITPTEAKLITWLVLLTLGFILQLIGAFV